MATQLSDQAQTRLAVAGLFAALAQTLGERDKAFVPNFERHLEYVYQQISHYESAPREAMEAVRWTGQILRGHS